METNVKDIVVHFPSAARREAHNEVVTIRSSNGHLMANRLIQYLRMEHDTKDLPEDERVTVDASNELLLGLANAFVGMRKSMRRKDYALDRKQGENDSWKAYAQWMFGVLVDLARSSEEFFQAVSRSKDGGDKLLSQIPLESDKFQSDLDAAMELIATCAEDEKEERCGDFPDDWGQPIPDLEP